jgi:peptide/nickel transport system permease protein
MYRYLGRKVLTYVLAFVLAVTVDWIIPRLMPGDPIEGILTKYQLQPGAAKYTYHHFYTLFGFNHPEWVQYFLFWKNLFHLNFQTSLYFFPSSVSSVIAQHILFTIALMVPAIVLSYLVGNRLGALAARRKVLDNTVLPACYIVSGTPYQWLALLLAYYVGIVLHLLPFSQGFDPSLVPAWSWTFAWSLLQHWFLPFLSLFIIGLGGWAIGMRNLIIYELESDYAHYLESLGSSRRLVRRYAYRNAVLPQLSGLAIALGVFVAGQVVTETVFDYPGIGSLIVTAIQNSDYFLMQGIFLIVIVGVLVANFLVDIVYVVVDPRTRLSMQGER